jgi:hypothetical protein
MLTELILVRAACGAQAPSEHRFAEFVCGAHARWTHFKSWFTRAG